MPGGDQQKELPICASRSYWKPLIYMEPMAGIGHFSRELGIAELYSL
jgi:hypothetical protein